MDEYTHGREHASVDEAHRELCRRLDEHLAAHDFALPEHSHAEHALTEHVHTDPDEIVPALVELAEEAGESVEAEVTATAEEVAEPEPEPSTPEPEVAPRRVHPMHRRLIGKRDDD
jgi:hypothetical protein